MVDGPACPNQTLYLDQVIRVWDLDSIDKELHELHTFLRTQPMTSESRRTIHKRIDLLLDRRIRAAKREEQTMIGRQS